jgi:MFS family permease
MVYPDSARVAVALLFLMHGGLVGSWAPHIPLAKAELGVGPGLFGWLLLAMALGGVVAMPLAGAAINRFGSAVICRATGVAMVLGLALPTAAETPMGLAAGLFVFGAALGALDVAMNAHAVAVETRLGRPVMSSFHGWYSAGAAAGAAGGGLAVAWLGAAVHVALALAVAFAMLAVAWRRLLPAATDRGLSAAHFGWPTRATLGLGALCFLALLIEGAALDWSAIHLREVAGADVSVAALGFSGFAAGMAVTRFLGDALRARLGPVVLVRASALGVALGLAGWLLAPSPWLAVPALLLAGLGLGNVVPVLFSGAGLAEPQAPGRGIAAVTTMGYAGFLLGPPLVGAVAELTGLGAALGLTVLASVVLVAGAGAAGSAGSIRRLR